ncbi:MAG: GspH/FimT family protein [Rudaea sp.]
MVGAMNIARTEAITRGRPVTLCPSTDGTSCSGSTWSGSAISWLALTDYAGNGGNGDGAGSTVRVWMPINSQDTASVSPAGVAYINFDRNGSAKIGSTAETTATFTLTAPDCTGQQAGSVGIAQAGRAQASYPVACP